jgi:hypothetical protein
MPDLADDSDFILDEQTELEHLLLTSHGRRKAAQRVNTLFVGFRAALAKQYARVSRIKEVSTEHSDTSHEGSHKDAVPRLAPAHFQCAAILFHEVRYEVRKSLDLSPPAVFTPADANHSFEIKAALLLIKLTTKGSWDQLYDSDSHEYAWCEVFPNRCYPNDATKEERKEGKNWNAVRLRLLDLLHEMSGDPSLADRYLRLASDCL